jgi:hypothetical protein
VHARTLDELAEASAQVRAAAASVLLDIQPATWRHHHGWTTTLPLGVRSALDPGAPDDIRLVHVVCHRRNAGVSRHSVLSHV